MQEPFTRRRLLLVQALLLPLAGCGFELRKAPDFAFRGIYVNTTSAPALGNELKRNLNAQGTVRLLDAPPTDDGGDVVLDLLSDQREKTVVGVNTTGQVREFQLRVRVRFRLRTPRGKLLLPDTELLQQRDISYNETFALAKEAEEVQMYRDMQSDIVQQLLRRLAAVRAIA